MTEEEKKLTTRVNRTNEADGANEVNGTNKPDGANETNVADNGVEQSIKNLEDRAAKNREFAESPVNIDTSGQTDWMAKLEQVRREYIESPEQEAAREQREKRNRRIAAISDGLVAMSNIAGAMAGATPIKPSTTMSAAHAKAVEDAAKRRRENADRYAIYSRYLSGLQKQQDKLNADRYDKAVKARQDAGKRADTLQGTAARLRQSRENSNRSYDLQKEKFEEQKEHNRKTLALQAERNAISRSKGNGGSSGKKEDELAAMKYWESLTDKEREDYRTMFGRDDDLKSDDKSFIDLVWKRRKAYLINHGRGDEIRTGGFNRSYNKGKGYGNNNGKGRGY